MDNSQLAAIVAQRVSERVFEDLSELIGEITMDVMVENGMNTLGEDAFENLMDISSRLFIGSN